MSTALQVTDISKTFHIRGRGRKRDHVAVDRVSFQIEAGTCLGIVGESGSGKTTLGRMIVGLESPTSGELVVAGEHRPARAGSAATRKYWARRIQMVFQDPYTSLDRRQSGSDMLHEILAFHGLGDRAARRRSIEMLADRVGLNAEILARTPSQLSGGQRQRLAIARALVTEPQILVLDEAVSALDVSVQAQVLNCLREIQRELGTTFLFISHDLAVIRHMADDVLVMKDGAVVEQGTAESVLVSPASAYTQRLKASVPGPGWKPEVTLVR